MRPLGLGGWLAGLVDVFQSPYSVPSHTQKGGVAPPQPGWAASLGGPEPGRAVTPAPRMTSTWSLAVHTVSRESRAGGERRTVGVQMHPIPRDHTGPPKWDLTHRTPGGFRHPSGGYMVGPRMRGHQIWQLGEHQGPHGNCSWGPWGGLLKVAHRKEKSQHWSLATPDHSRTSHVRLSP